MKIRLSISTKLIFVVTAIVMLAMTAVVYSARVLFTDESIGHAQAMNLDVAKSLSEEVRTILKDAIDKTSVMGETVAQFQGQTLSTEAQQLVQNVLRSNDEMISFGVYRPDQNTAYKELFFAAKDEALAEFDLNLDELKTRPLKELIGEVGRHPDDVTLFNSSPFFKKPILTIAFLTKKSKETKERWLIRCDLRQSAFIRLFIEHSSVMAYLLDSEGNLLIHSNPAYVMQKYNYSNYDIVQQFKSSKAPDFQKEFKDERGNYYLGAYSRTGVGGTGVFAQVDRAHALRAVDEFQYRSMLLTAVVMGLAFILNFIFSKTMTSPLSRLYQATEKIAEGKFDVNLENKSHDEIGALTKAFKKMVVGLQERDKLKTTFSKFHSKEIAQKILSGEIKLGGERKMATVFFSDIRNFTAMSEEMTPDEVVNLLNEYMTEMVKIINSRHGVVDKYVGDAIMALWGVPNAGPDDAINAVLTCLDMRRALKVLNKKRTGRGQRELRIGMGVHTGEVLAGNIGSEERLEYTVIGDNVNQASRIESANKELNSDILISEATYILVKSKGVTVGPALPIHVKGRAQTLVVYQVIGVKDAAGMVSSDLTPSEQERIMNQRQVSGTQTVQVDHELTAATVVASQYQAGPQGGQQSVGMQQGGMAGAAGAPAPAGPRPVFAHPPQEPIMAPTPHGQGGYEMTAPLAGQPQPQPNTLPNQAFPTQTMTSLSSFFPNVAGNTAVNFGPQGPLGRVPGVIQPPGAYEAIPNSSPNDLWYLVRNPNSPEAEGPYTMSQLKLIASQPGFAFDIGYVFRQGDLQMTPMAHLPEISRRTPRSIPAIQAPLPSPDIQAQAVQDEWYIYGDETRTYGPYTLEQIREAVDAGHLTRTTYCWKQGMAGWIFVHQIPSFDRRTPGRVDELQPLPVIKKSS